VIAREISIELAQYLAYHGSIWHEILTWFGFKGIGIWPEYTSAFSWEDNYSNLLGCRIGAAALRDNEREFSDAVTVLLDRELRALAVQPRPMARRAGDAVRNWWFTGNLWSCDIIKRHFGVGLGDGMVTPWLVPGIAQCNGAVAQKHPAPTLAAVQEHGFSVIFEIEPKEWEKAAIFQIVHGQNKKAMRIEPARHFGPLIEYIRAQAVKRYGPFVDDSRTPASPESRSDVPETADFADLASLAARWITEDMP
jgi:hypothetical protein